MDDLDGPWSGEGSIPPTTDEGLLVGDEEGIDWGLVPADMIDQVVAAVKSGASVALPAPSNPEQIARRANRLMGRE